MKKISDEITVTLNEKQMSELKEIVADVVRDEISTYNMLLNRTLDKFLKSREHLEKENTIKMDIMRKLINE